MKVYKIIIAVGLILLFCLFAIEYGLFSSERNIPYSKINNINWYSFKSLPDFSANYSAEISTSIDYKIENDSIIVESMMHPFKSYVIIPELLPAIVLNHEKYHFKITELLSRKFKKEISYINKPLSKREIKDIYRKVYEKENLVQKVYDLDTKHGKDTLIQSIWFKEIDTLLKTTESPQYKYRSSLIIERSIIPIKPSLAYLYKTIMTRDTLRLQLTYFDNGNLKSEIIYKNEKPDGYYYDWYENGSINHTILYKNGARNGFSVTFNMRGDTIETLYYQNNRIKD